MDRVLGRTAGNAVEVREAIDHLTGAKTDERLRAVTLALSEELLRLGGIEDADPARGARRRQRGRALRAHGRRARRPGGHARARPPARRRRSPSRRSPRSPACSSAVDVRAVGVAIIGLGGGRARETDEIDHAVGLTEVAAPGERVGPGERPLAIVHARDETSASGRVDGVARGQHRRRHAARRPRPRPGGAAVIPKAELHVHLEGTAPPDLIRRIAQRNGLPVPDGLFGDDERFVYTRLPRLPARLRRRRERHPHRRGLPRHHLRVPAVVRGRGRDLRRADRFARPRGARRPQRRGASRRHRARHRRRPRPRHRGADPDLRRAQLRRRAGAARRPPRRRAPAPLRRRLLDGRRRGELPGRTCSPRPTRSRRRPAWAARCTRASGRARERPRRARAADHAHQPRRAGDRGSGAGRELAERGITLECCPTSNVVLGVFPSYEEHPLLQLAEAGVRHHARQRRSARTSALRSAANTRSRTSGWASMKNVLRRLPQPPSMPHSATRAVKTAACGQVVVSRADPSVP